MENLIDGIENGVFLFLLFYFFCANCCLFILLFKFRSFVFEYLIHIWHYIKHANGRKKITITVISEDCDTENESSKSFDVRIFNANCCVCLNDSCIDPVASFCGHCFCGTCAIHLIEHSSVPMKCPLCRQECHSLFIPRRSSQKIKKSVVDAIALYNSREHRFPFISRVQYAPTMLQHLIQSFSIFQRQLIFRIKCHIIVIAVMAFCYVLLPTDLLPENVLGFLGLVDDLIVIIFLFYLVRRTYGSMNSPVFEDIRVALE